LRIGAYQKGADASLDLAVAHMPEINCLLRQGPQDSASLAGTIQALLALPT
jgi:flagellar biosynthesis/type III secretory pathway ATPase